MTDEEFKEAVRKEIQKELSRPLEKEWVCSCGSVVLKPDDHQAHDAGPKS